MLNNGSDNRKGWYEKESERGARMTKVRSDHFPYPDNGRLHKGALRNDPAGVDPL